MKITNFSEHKDKKEGIITPLRLAEDITGAIERGEVEEIIAFTIDKDGYIKAGWSNMNTLRALGLIEAGKDIVLKTLEE